jgi:hypothetical protein
LRELCPGNTINNNLTIVRGTNFKLRTSVGFEFIVQLPIVQAPFRIYFAINPNRYHQSITSPAGAFNRDSPIFNQIQPAELRQQILNNQIFPDLEFL